MSDELPGAKLKEYAGILVKMIIVIFIKKILKLSGYLQEEVVHNNAYVIYSLSLVQTYAYLTLLESKNS